jgi:hypothetical protein
MGPTADVGIFEKKKNLLSLLGFKPQTVQPVA